MTSALPHPDSIVPGVLPFYSVDRMSVRYSCIFASLECRAISLPLCDFDKPPPLTPGHGIFPDGEVIFDVDCVDRPTPLVSHLKLARR